MEQQSINPSPALEKIPPGCLNIMGYIELKQDLYHVRLINSNKKIRNPFRDPSRTATSLHPM